MVLKNVSTLLRTLFRHSSVTQTWEHFAMAQKQSYETLYFSLCLFFSFVLNVMHEIGTCTPLMVGVGARDWVNGFLPLVLLLKRSNCFSYVFLLPIRLHCKVKSYVCIHFCVCVLGFLWESEAKKARKAQSLQLRHK